ncbi:MAG: molybdopterin-synthase adenylyltransferase MoeB [Desulfovibrio sp.]|jgi:adenylyltransferase/sulfurtransferase|nr:molybdopterin-synthase adenylyltransferase MoeB [Desulfovibrio sp.]
MSRIADDRLNGLSTWDFSRYSRHLLLPEIGVEGQKRIKASRVLIVGTGGLGAPVGLYLAAAGVGTIGLVDYDLVEESNLQRQVIHTEDDIDRPKVASARDAIHRLNSRTLVVMHNERLTSQNAMDILKGYDVVVDGTDNFPTRYLLNDACALLGLPVVYGSVFQFEGQASVFDAKNGPCLRCLFPEPPPPGLVPSCGEGGVMGVLPGIIGCIQACEAIKLVVGGGETLTGRLLIMDGWRMRFVEIRIDKNPECPLCGSHPTITELIDYEEFCGVKPKEEYPVEHITPAELKARIDKGDDLQIIDIREPHEQALYAFPGAISIPIGQLARRSDELDPSKDAVFICKIGQRSAYAIQIMEECGYEGKMLNLQGGVNAWAREVDKSIQQY